jgi:hypothetical protein
MASDFRIVAHRNSDNLHLLLAGDFEAGAAHKLVRSIRMMGLGVHNVFVHTNEIERLDPGAHEVLRIALHGLDNRFFGNLVFTGKDASLLAPENSVVL